MGFLVSDFNIVIYIEQNKSSTICFLGTNLEHCTFYHFYFAQAQYPRQKKRETNEELKISRKLSKSLQFLVYRKVSKNLLLHAILKKKIIKCIFYTSRTN